MASKRTAGLVAACVVAMIVVVGMLTTCEETVNSSPESPAVAPAAAAETATTRPVAPRRVRAAPAEATGTRDSDETDDETPARPIPDGEFVVVPVDVVDSETGRPVAGAMIAGGLGNWQITDAAGHATVYMPPGWILALSTSEPSHVPSKDYLRTASESETQASLRVELVPAGTLRGVVRDPYGNTVEDAFVDVRRDDVDDVLQSERSDADGAYVVEGLVFGASYRAAASGRPGAASAESAVLVATKEHPVVVADLRLRRNGTIELVVLDGDDPIDESLRVKLEVIVSGDRGVWTTRGTSEPKFDTTGRNWFAVTFDDRAPFMETVDVPEGVTVKKTIHLTPGESISGLVVDDTGNPVEDAWVRDAPVEDAWLREDAGTSRVREHRSDTRSRADGSFELTLVAAGDHELSVSPPFEYEDVVVSGVKAPSENVRLVVPRRGVLKVRAVFDGDMKPAADARIAFHGTLGGKPWDIDRTLPEGGRFEIAWPAGVSGKVGVGVEGFVPVTRDVTVPSGATVDLGEIRMRPACSVAGVLCEESGSPCPGRTLLVRGLLRDQTCKTGSDGRFSFRGVPPGSLRIDLVDQPYASFRVDVPGGKDAVLVVPVRAMLQVFASSPSGQRLAGRRVEVRDAERVVVVSGTTDANGSWASRLTAGRWSVDVENGPHGDADVRADDVTVLRLR